MADRAVVLVREVTGHQPCAVEVRAGQGQGQGQAIVLACDYPADLSVYAALIGQLASPRGGVRTPPIRVW